MKFFQSIVLAMVLAVAALAQYPVGPNTGAANTPYSTNAFSETFNGPVTRSKSVV